MKGKTIFFMGILVLAVIAGIFVGIPTGHTTFEGYEDSTIIEFKTNKGIILIVLYDDMPITTENFERLIKEEFYDGVTFHRVMEGFMIQSGDPTATGYGDPGYKIQDEFTHGGGNKNNRGTISMANSGPNTGGSQFFINTADNNMLDLRHPAFGEVIKGMNVVDRISKVETDGDPPTGGNKPLKDIIIKKMTIVN